jgi:hypothetical protein
MAGDLDYRCGMQPLAIQAALDNLVETVRTSLMAEFLELLRDGKPAAAPRAPRSKRKARSRAAGKSPKRASKKKVAKASGGKR